MSGLLNKIKGAIHHDKATAANAEQDASYAEQDAGYSGSAIEPTQSSAGQSVTFSQPNFSQSSTGPAASLDTFLTGAKLHLQKAIKDKDRVTLVMGDEHADLDSVVSSILFAYLRTASPPAGAWTKVYTPLLNASRGDIASREILLRLLPEIGLKDTHLIALEDLVSHGSTKSGLIAQNTKFFLVDHNKMVGRLDQDYSQNVLGCIDHHTDESFVPTSTDPEPRIIGCSGSCTSLVVNWGSKEWTYLDGEESKSSQNELAKLALAPILIDTQNLNSSAATEEDVRAVEFLESKIHSSGVGSSPYDRTSFYDFLTGGSASRHGLTGQQGSTTNYDTSSSTSTGALGASTIASGTGYYDPYAKEETTGATGFPTRFKGDVNLEGSSTTGTTSADYSTGQSSATYGDTTTDTTGTSTETGAQSGGITGAITGAVSYLTGRGNTEGTTTGDYNTTGANTTSSTGQYANETERDVSTTGTQSSLTGTSSNDTSTHKSGGFLSSRLPWFSSGNDTTTDETTTGLSGTDATTGTSSYGNTSSGLTGSSATHTSGVTDGQYSGTSGAYDSTTGTTGTTSTYESGNSTTYKSSGNLLGGEDAASVAARVLGAPEVSTTSGATTGLTGTGSPTTGGSSVVQDVEQAESRI